jgi:hypothetical protein
LWTNRLPLNIQDINATQEQFALDDVAQLADKIGEVTPPPCVARVSSSGDDICTLTARTDELARQVAALSASPSRPRSPRKTFVTPCGTVTSPLNLLIPPPFF